MLHPDAKDVKWNGIESILSQTMYKFSSNSSTFTIYVYECVCMHMLVSF